MKTAKKIFGILIGNFILAFGIAAFVLPQGLITGGVTGISIVPVSYTHLDVYKRQILRRARMAGWLMKRVRMREGKKQELSLIHI